jgi:cobaltochelatase CobN
MKTLRICYFSATALELPSLSQGIMLLRGNGEMVEVAARTQTQLFDQSRVTAFVEQAAHSDAIILTLHGGKASCPAFDALLQRRVELRAAGTAVPYLHIQPTGGDEEALQLAQEHSDGIETGDWQKLFAYLNHGGAENYRCALLSMASLLGRTAASIPPPAPIPLEGVYHPDLGIVSDVEEYARERIAGGRPTVGISFYQGYWANGNVAHIDALIREIESRGANVMPVFSLRLKDSALGNRAFAEIVATYFQSRIDVLINVMPMSMTLTSPEYRTIFPDLNVPVLQAMTSWVPYTVWKESLQGVSPMEVVYHAAQPEFDGNLITTLVATREEDQVDPVTGALLSHFVPVPDRVAAVVSSALKWAKLRRTPNPEKRVAVVFHHYPPRNDRIGCAAGLDSFASVKLLLECMAAAGYQVEKQYKNGDELANALLSRMTSDRRWLSPEQLAERSEASADRAVYLPWHEALPKPVREKMTADWGPMPGELFTHNDVLYFAGLRNGNVFLTIQPPRGYLEKVDAIYHDLHLSPPHQYLAQYHWLRDVFHADAVIHVGKHGSLEWLPGKALGLSEECYPDLAIMDFPNIYPYIINDPSEGTQAKRRSYCCIIDHLTPAFTNADLYEDLTGVERAVADYTEAARQDPAKLPVMAGLLWDAVKKADLDQDLKVTEEDVRENTDDFLKHLHEYLSDLADTMISDGLHVMGVAPEDERLVCFLTQLTRLPNGDVPSLREEVLLAMGHHYEEAVEHRGEALAHFGGFTGGQLIATAQKRSEALVRALAANEYAAAAIPAIVAAEFGVAQPRVEVPLHYVATRLLPNVRRVGEEIQATLRALAGGFVEPGPSGAPSRGQADILPTGKNFYSVDPRMIPSRAAWEVGKSLGDSLLERYRQEEKDYPRSLGIIVWGGPTMRSRGDDIAEILYLLGVRPRWLANGVVDGLEIIPARELGRPRIDVVPRISGFFRDSFPNLVTLIDDAVAMVAALQEPPETNFIRQHVYADLEDYRQNGMSEEDAWRAATLRVFGCPPGTYGAGVAELVESKAWQTRKDLGDVYIRYSAHAYGKGMYGDQRPQTFRRLLSRVDVTVKNEDSREYDMLSCTDFYNYYGGLIAAVETVRGKMPVALAGDTSDPRRAKLRSTAEEAKHILRSRLLNPKWLDGLKRHGYKGAGDISKVMDILIGWDATADVMEDWMYERVARKYALDTAMQQWLKEVNPYALQNILDKLLETIQRGMWSTSEEMKQKLQDAYLSVEGDIEEAVEVSHA